MAALFAKIWNKIRVKRVSYSIMIVGLDNSGKTSILNCLQAISGSIQQRMLSSSPTPSNLRSKDFSDSTTDRKQDLSDVNSSLKTPTSETKVLPTIGYNYERSQYNGLVMTVLDFSGQTRYRGLWQEFYNAVDAIVFVVDSSDPIRLVVARDELETMLSHPYFNTLSECQIRSTPSQVDRSFLAQKQITISQGKLVQTPLEPSDLSTSKEGDTTHQKSRTKVPILFLANKSDLANSVETEVIVKALNLNLLPIERHPWMIQATSVTNKQGIIGGFDWLANQLTQR